MAANGISTLSIPAGITATSFNGGGASSYLVSVGTFNYDAYGTGTLTIRKDSGPIDAYMAQVIALGPIVIIWVFVPANGQPSFTRAMSQPQTGVSNDGSNVATWNLSTSNSLALAGSGAGELNSALIPNSTSFVIYATDLGIGGGADKEARQIAKLDIAAAKRQGKTVALDGTITGSVDDTKPYYRAANALDTTLLPTLYSGNTVVDNVNTVDSVNGVLAEGRPWSTVNVDTAITVIETSETGATLILNLDSRNTNSLPRTAAPATWFDLTANANDATIYGGTIAYGQQGGQFCAVFPGGDAHYAQAKNGVYFDGNSFTIQSWVYVTAVLNWNRIIDFGNGAGSNNILLSNTYGASGKPGIYIEGTEFQSTYPGSSTVLLNAWHQICATFTRNTSGNTNQGIARIFIDGQQYGSGTTSIPVNITRTRCYIGKSNWGNPPDPNMNGGIGSLQIYNGALTSAEMLSNYNTTKTYYGL